MEQLNYRPDNVAGAVSQSFDRAVGTADAPNVEASEPIREMNGSQLVGAQATVSAGVSVATPVVGESGMAKRKRGRPRGPTKAPPAKKIKEDEDEDVCFICFDGGSLVLCDRRGCPKAYHPACIKRDEAFFRSAAKWNCGWHICSMCQKTSHHMCYTCTYSLCKGCIKKADYVCVRGDKGFCTLCMKTIMLIENNGQGMEEMAQVDFDDKTSWEYLFKVYWVYLKEKLSLTVDELTRAKNPWKVAATIGCERISPDVRNGANDLKSVQHGANDLKNLQNGTNDLKNLHYGVGTLESLPLDMSPDTLEANNIKRRKTDEQLNLLHEATLIVEKPGGEIGIPLVGSKEWATRELLEFVAHMKNGDTSPLSELEVQNLMSEYIKKNNLQDPRLESQVLCDSRLYNLFGKPRVGHFEMLKLLENHFLVKEDSHKNIVGTVARQVDPDWNNDSMLIKDNKHKPRQKGEEQAPHANLDEYAAIDVHNINLIYLRRGLMENLLEDGERFHLKVVGSIVRIRISSSDQKQDMYRLVQVVGTSKVDQPYKLGNRTTDVVLEVLNLNKKETVSADSVSNEEFSEEECRHLRQSIRCGLVKQFTVGEILEKAVALQSVRVNDWLETEILRLNNLLDRASEKGRKKELREIVEKLQLLKTPEERQRRLSEIPEVHADPKMNPECVSEEDAAELNNNKRGEYMKTRSSGSRGKGAKPSSPQKRSDGSNETSASTLTMGNTLSAMEGEADELWHYKDPNGRVQGPFTLVQLQKWSTTGYFPIDMRIWASRQENSVLLTDALKGEFHKALQFNNASLQSDVGGASDSKSYENQIGGTHVPSSTLSVSNVGNNENKSDNRSLSGQSSEQILGGTNNSNSNPSATASVTKSTYVIEMNGTAVLSNPHSQTVKVSNDSWEGQIGQKEGNVPSVLPVQDSPKTSNNADILLNNREKQSEPSKLVVQDSVPSWSTASNLVAGSGAHLTEIADEWGRYPSTPAKFSAGEWGPGGLSSKLPESTVDHVDTSKSNIDQLIHSSSSQQRASTMSWQAMVSEPIEFNTLAEESVSDLLAEVDAMESSQCGLPSPTSKRNFVDELFYGSIEEFSPIPDQGARSDGFSSSGDMHLPCQSNTPEELVGPSHANVFDLNNAQKPKSEVTVSWNNNNTTIQHGGADGQAVPKFDLNNAQKAKSEVAVSWNHNNNTTIQHGGADVQTVPKPATKVEMEREIKSNDAPTIIQHGRSGTATPECTVNAVEEGEIKSIDLTIDQKKRTEYIRPTEPLAIPVKDKAKVRNKTTIQQRGGDRTYKESATRTEEEGEIKSTEISQPIQSAAQPLTTRQQHVDQTNAQRSGRQSHGTTNAGSRGSIGGAAGSQKKYSGDRYNSSPRDRGHNQGRGPWNRQSYGSGGGGGGAGGGGGVGGGYSRPTPSPKGRVCKFYESGRCKKGALCGYLHP